MTILTLVDGALRVRVTTIGGAIVDGFFHDRPIFRPYPEAKAATIDPLKCASFPFVPFGNRVEGNAFEYLGKAYKLSQNTEWDPLYLHGDGWTSDWTIQEQCENSIVMELRHTDKNYTYTATQSFILKNDKLELALSVRNDGFDEMPFGIGHHFFFPLTANTTLKAHAQKYWTEKEQFLPDRCRDIPRSLDFSRPTLIPRRWVNNGFDDWDGHANISWPENGLSLKIEGAKAFDRYFVFHSDTDFEPTFQDDYFCFEPMSHSANAHHSGSGLSALAQHEVLFGSCVLLPMLD